MSSISSLREAIEDVLKYESFSSSDLINVLHPISSYISTTSVYTSLNEIGSLLITDKSRSPRFEIADIRMFGNNESAVMCLVNILINSISGVVGSKLAYSPHQSELLMFKLFVYCFMVIIPRSLGRKLTIDEKSVLLITALEMYGILCATSQAFEVLYATTQSNMKQQLKSDKTVCVCNTGSPTSEDIAYARRSILCLELKGHIHSIHNQNDLEVKFRNIEKRLKRQDNRGKL